MVEQTTYPLPADDRYTSDLMIVVGSMSFFSLFVVMLKK